MRDLDIAVPGDAGIADDKEQEKILKWNDLEKKLRIHGTCGKRAYSRLLLDLLAKIMSHGDKAPTENVTTRLCLLKAEGYSLTQTLATPASTYQIVGTVNVQ